MRIRGGERIAGSASRFLKNVPDGGKQGARTERLGDIGVCASCLCLGFESPLSAYEVTTIIGMLSGFRAVP